MLALKDGPVRAKLTIIYRIPICFYIVLTSFMHMGVLLTHIFVNHSLWLVSMETRRGQYQITGTEVRDGCESHGCEPYGC